MCGGGGPGGGVPSRGDSSIKNKQERKDYQQSHVPLVSNLPCSSQPDCDVLGTGLAGQGEDDLPRGLTPSKVQREEMGSRVGGKNGRETRYIRLSCRFSAESTKIGAFWD